MSTRNFPGGKGRPARKADKLASICEPIAWKMWEPPRLASLWAVTAGYRDSLTRTLSIIQVISSQASHAQKMCKITLAWGANNRSKNSICWGVKPFSLVKLNRRFERIYRLRFQGKRLSEARNHNQAIGKQIFTCCLFIAWFTRRYNSFQSPLCAPQLQHNNHSTGEEFLCLL
jgi:hypothetical protein